MTTFTEDSDSYGNVIYALQYANYMRRSNGNYPETCETFLIYLNDIIVYRKS